MSGASIPPAKAAAVAVAKKKAMPSPSEIAALRAARAAKKEREAREAEERAKAGAVEEQANVGEDGKPLFVAREWAKVKGVDAKEGVRIISWNILAQGLVRRKLFPGSDCLKWKDREAGLRAELVAHKFDICCFQEVDRLDAHGPNLERAGYAYEYKKGYNAKAHGLLIAWRTQPSAGRTTFKKEPLAKEIVFYDDATIGEDSTTTGCSRVTRNIALLVALQTEQDGASFSSSAPRSVIVATTHLFWHPQHAYERARQAGILVRSATKFRDSLPEAYARDSPIVLAGDFNDQPHSATYQLLRGQALNAHAREEVERSMAIHKSVDDKREREALAAKGALDGQAAEAEEAEEEEEEEEAEEAAQEEQDSDHMLKNCRAATPNDGLLSVAALQQLYDLTRPEPSAADISNGEAATAAAPALSAYGENHDKLESNESGNYFGSSQRGRERFDDPDWKEGDVNVHHGASVEPMWTLFSSIFSLTLDYIWLLPRVASPSAGAEGTPRPTYPKVTGLLRTHRTETLQPGVPRKGVCASDHVAIGAEIEL